MPYESNGLQSERASVLFLLSRIDVFPWFAEATVKQISHVERFGADHMHWPDLDVDLTLDMIDHPEQYPLKFK
jgi:hypothetical protein